MFIGIGGLSLLGGATTPTDYRAVVAAFGGPQNMLGIYDVRYGVTLATGTMASGTVSSWTDVLGIGPTIVADGATKPSIAVTGAAGQGGVGISTDGSTNGLQSAASSYFSLATGKVGFAFIGTIAGSTPSVTLQDAGNTAMLGVVAPFAGVIGTTYKLATTNREDNGGLVASSTSIQRLIFADAGSGGVNQEVAGSLKFFQTVNNGVGNATVGNIGGSPVRHTPSVGAASSTMQLGIGHNADGTRVAVNIRALILYKVDRNRAITNAIKTFGSTYHAPVYVTGSPAAYVEGTSIPAGANTTVYSTDNWFAKTLAQAGMSSYANAGQNWGNAAISGWFLDYINQDSNFMVESTLGTFRSKDLYFLDAGTNDVTLGTPESGSVPISGAACIQLLITVLTRRRATGAKVVLIPPIPRGDCSQPLLAQLQIVADWCQASGARYADVVVPYWLNAHFNVWTFGSDSGTVGVGTGYYAADKVHPTTVGHSSLALDATAGVYPAIAGIR